MKRKELKISPVPESKFYFIYAHILLLWPFTPFIFAAIYLFFIGDKTRSIIIEQFMKEKVLLTFVIIAFLVSVLNMFRELFNYLIVEEVCYVDKKTFFYQKFRRAFGMRKLMKSFEIPLLEVVEVKEVKKPSIIYYFLNPVSHRNSVEIETRDGIKYAIMNDFRLGSKNDTNTETRQERAKRIFNEVKDLITEAKNENTFNI